MNSKRAATSNPSIRTQVSSDQRSYPSSDKSVLGRAPLLDEMKIKSNGAKIRVKAEFDLWTSTERHVTPAELARYWRVSTDTIYRDIRKGALPAYRVGSSGALRIRIEEARRYGRPGA